jgi:hypothetical protein
MMKIRTLQGVSGGGEEGGVGRTSWRRTRGRRGTLVLMLWRVSEDVVRRGEGGRA